MIIIDAVRKVLSFLKDLFDSWNEDKSGFMQPCALFFSLAPQQIIAIAVGEFIAGTINIPSGNSKKSG